MFNNLLTTSTAVLTKTPKEEAIELTTYSKPTTEPGNGSTTTSIHGAIDDSQTDSNNNNDQHTSAVRTPMSALAMYGNNLYAKLHVQTEISAAFQGVIENYSTANTNNNTSDLVIFNNKKTNIFTVDEDESTVKMSNMKINFAEITARLNLLEDGANIADKKEFLEENCPFLADKVDGLESLLFAMTNRNFRDPVVLRYNDFDAAKKIHFEIANNLQQDAKRILDLESSSPKNDEDHAKIMLNKMRLYKIFIDILINEYEKTERFYSGSIEGIYWTHMRFYFTSTLNTDWISIHPLYNTMGDMDNKNTVENLTKITHCLQHIAQNITDKNYPLKELMTAQEAVKYYCSLTRSLLVIWSNNGYCSAEYEINPPESLQDNHQVIKAIVEQVRWDQKNIWQLKRESNFLNMLTNIEKTYIVSKQAVAKK